jgi:hypothetical protein
MKFVFGNKSHRIWFRYGKRMISLRGHGEVERVATEVFITEDEPNGKTVMTSFVVRRPGEADHRDTARRMALAKALAESDASEAFRSEVWKTYHSRPGGLYIQRVVKAAAKAAADAATKAAKQAASA